MKRKITIKVDSALASQVLSELGLSEAEIEVEMEDSGATYKKLSGMTGVKDWEFSSNKDTGKTVEGVEDHGVDDASILFEALYALKLSHPTRTFESLTKEDLDEQIQYIGSHETSFNHLAIKVTLEKSYSSAEEAKEKVMEIFKKQWDSVLTYGTALGFLFHIYGKK